MVWVFGILKFLFAAVGIFSLLLFVLVCIATVIYPQFDVNAEEGTINIVGGNARYVLAIICAVSFALLIAIL